MRRAIQRAIPSQSVRNFLSRPVVASAPLQVTMEMLGRAQRAAVFKERTTMIATGDHEEEVNKRIAQVKAEGQATDSEFDREKAEERVAKLGGAIGRIKGGAATETELKDKKLRYEDALLDWVTPQTTGASTSHAPSPSTAGTRTRSTR